MNLKKLFCFLFICQQYLLSAQINEKFEENLLSESWNGNDTCFVITPENQLQLKAPQEVSSCYLSKASDAIINGEWGISIRLNFNPSGSNYVRYYLCSDNPVLTDSLNGYFLQIGNSDDQILLYKQTGKTLKKLGESEVKRLNSDTVKIEIKVLNDTDGNWKVLSKTAEESDFTEEFTCNDLSLEKSLYAGISCHFTTTRREDFLFNYIVINGSAIQRPNLPEIWQGDDSCFIVAPDDRIKLKAPADKGQAYLSTPSEVIKNATWELSVQMNFNPTNSNYFRYYLCSDNPVLTDSLDGYFLQLGNNDDQLLLYKQIGLTVKKLGVGEIKRLDSDTVRIEIKVEKDDEGNWTVWSKKPDESAFTQEFQCTDNSLERSYYSGIYCKYSSTRNEHFFFDSFSAVGDSYLDEVSPEIESVKCTPNSFAIKFTEPLDTTNFFFHFEESPDFQFSWKSNQSEITFTFNTSLQQRTKYILYLDQFEDKAGHKTVDKAVSFGLPESVSPQDVILNEVLFHPLSTGKEYVEIYNRSNKVINLSEINLATRRIDLSFYSSKSLPEKLFFPGEYLVITSDIDAVCNLYNCRDKGALILLEKLPVYANTKGCVVLIDNDDNVIDELNYNASMHNPLLSQTQGVSLERESFEKDSWNSASEDSGSGTPGYKNSQYSDDDDNPTHLIYLYNEIGYPHLTADNFLSIAYSLEKNGYVANITIFNVDGKEISKLKENFSLSTEGRISWDGRDNNNNVVSIAPYIVLFEAFHPDGDIIRKSMVGIISK
jgi:hypothetical protein